MPLDRRARDTMMNAAMSPKPLSLLRVISAAALLLAVCSTTALLAPSFAHAQTVQPWTPASSDTVQRLVSSAKVRFREQAADTLSARDVQAFELVGQAARRLLRLLGTSHMLQAPIIEATLDSLGADVDVVTDPELPSIVFMMVRNPYRPGSSGVGYLLWYRGSDLRMQGVSFPAGVRPKLRAWYTGRASGPYGAVIVYTRREVPARFGFKYLRMSADGFFWNLVQYEGEGPELGEPGDVTFADINHDGRPEIINYQRAEVDSFLTLERGTPPLIQERIYTERPEGFVAHDARILPGPVSTLRLFALTLMANDRESAKRLLLDPDRLDDAMAEGWGRSRARGAWTVEYGEENQAWPEWLALKVTGDGGPRRWIFQFTLRDGRWVIRDWKPVVVNRTTTAVGP